MMCNVKATGKYGVEQWVSVVLFAVEPLCGGGECGACGAGGSWGACTEPVKKHILLIGPTEATLSLTHLHFESIGCLHGTPRLPNIVLLESAFQLLPLCLLTLSHFHLELCLHTPEHLWSLSLKAHFPVEQSFQVTRDPRPVVNKATHCPHRRYYVVDIEGDVLCYAVHHGVSVISVGLADNISVYDLKEPLQLLMIVLFFLKYCHSQAT